MAESNWLVTGSGGASVSGGWFEDPLLSAPPPRVDVAQRCDPRPLVFRVRNCPAIDLRDFFTNEDVRMEKDRRKAVHVRDHVEELGNYVLRELGVERERMLCQ